MRKTTLILLFLAALLILWADDLPPIINHLPLLNTPMYGTPQKVNATITDDATYNSPITLTELYYSTDNADFAILPLINMGSNSYSSTIPAFPMGTQLWYYLKAADSFGNITQSPTRTYQVQDPTWLAYGGFNTYLGYTTNVTGALNAYTNPLYGSGYSMKLNSTRARLRYAGTANLYIYKLNSLNVSQGSLIQVAGPISVTMPGTTTVETDLSALGIYIDTPYFCVSYQDVAAGNYWATQDNLYYNRSYIWRNGTLYNFSAYGTLMVHANISTGQSLNPSLSESFEGEMFPPANWSSVNGGDANDWLRSTEAPHSGSAHAVVDSPWPPGPDHDDWLITPRLRPTVANHTFSFWARRWSVSIFDRFNIKLSTSGNQAADFTVSLASNVMPTVAYQQFTYDLSSYIGQDVYLAIQATSYQGWKLFVDDVAGIPLAPVYTAPAVPGDLSPANAATGIYLNRQFTWLLNGGNPTGTKVYLDTVNPPVASFNLGIVNSFTPPAMLLPNTTYYWKVGAYNTFGEAASAVQSFTTGPVALYPDSHPLYNELPDIGQLTLGTFTNPAGPPPEIYNNPTANHGYSDFTGLGVIQLHRLNQYPVTITQITSFWNLMNCTAAIFIDFNHNGNYDLPQEQVFQAFMTVDENPITGLTSWIPADAELGNTGMRVVLQSSDGEPIPPTGTYEYGETEDYVVNIGLALPPNPVSMVYPADGATNIPKYSFDFSWTPDLAGGSPTAYTVYMANSAAGILSGYSWTTSDTHFNPVLQGGVAFGYLDTWYWTIKATNATGNATVSPVHSFQIMGDPTITIPYNVLFNTPVLPSGWSQASSAGLPSDRWSFWGEAWVCLGSMGSGTTRMMSPPVNTENTPNLAVNFQGFAYLYDSGIIYKLQYSHDMINWLDLNWGFPEGPDGYSGAWTAAITGITAPRTFFAWVLDGDQTAMEACGLVEVMIDAFIPPEPTLQSDGLLYWDPVPLINSYKVYSADDPAGTYTLETTTANSFWQTSLGAGKKFYKVHSNTELPVAMPPETKSILWDEASMRRMMREYLNK